MLCDKLSNSVAKMKFLYELNKRFLSFT